MRGRDQPAAAGLQDRRLGVGALLAVVLHLQPAAPLRLVAGGEAVDLLRRAEEAGVDHAQRLEQPRMQELAEALPRQLLHQVAHHIDRHRVVPPGARRELQWQLAQLLHHRLQPARGLEVVDLQLAIGGVDAGAHHEAVGEAGGVGDQIDHLHRPLGGRGDEGRRRIGQQGRHAAGVDPELLPGGNVGGDGVVEADQALLDQHHQSHRGDRLGHRIDAQDRVLAHRLVALDVHVAGHAGVDQLALAMDHGQDARQVAAVDVAVGHHLIELLQAR